MFPSVVVSTGILKDDIVESVKKGQVPQLCIGSIAKETNSGFLDAISDFCYAKWPYWFRVRVNDYWEGNVFSVVNRFNDRNVARVKGSTDTITPYSAKMSDKHILESSLISEKQD